MQRLAATNQRQDAKRVLEWWTFVRWFPVAILTDGECYLHCELCRFRVYYPCVVESANESHYTMEQLPERVGIVDEVWVGEIWVGGNVGGGKWQPTFIVCKRPVILLFQLFFQNLPHSGYTS